MRERYFTEATEVHHFRPVVEFPALALDLDNLESLCWHCHEATKPRSRAGDKNINGVRIIRIVDEAETELYPEQKHDGPK